MDNKHIEQKETCTECIHYCVCPFHLTGKENEKCVHFYRKQEWISVEELPKESGWYIVNVIDPLGISRVTLMVFTKIDGWGISDVAHWMPLPEPPKMKGGAE